VSVNGSVSWGSGKKGLKTEIIIENEYYIYYNSLLSSKTRFKKKIILLSILI